MLRLAAPSLIAALALFAAADPAEAKLEFCNETDAKRSIAIGYSEDDAWVSEGWWVLDPGECKTVVGGDLKQRYYYYRATTPGTDFPGEGYMFCTQSEPFTIVGDEDCEARGYEREDFRKLDTGETAKSFKLTLTGGASSDGSAAAPAPAPTPPAARPAGAAAPGTHGEPATITGVFRGCAMDGDPVYCEIHADDWIYTVPQDDRTPAAVFDDLRSMPDGATVTVEGDIAGYGDIHVDMTARRITVAAPATAASQLGGLWQSAQDPASSIRFDNGSYFDYYNGDAVDIGQYELGGACNGMDVDLIVHIKGESEPYCYFIDYIDGSHLTLLYMGAPDALEYRRAQ